MEEGKWQSLLPGDVEREQPQLQQPQPPQQQQPQMQQSQQSTKPGIFGSLLENKLALVITGVVLVLLLVILYFTMFKKSWPFSSKNKGDVESQSFPQNPQPQLQQPQLQQPPQEPASQQPKNDTKDGGMSHEKLVDTVDDDELRDFINKSEQNQPLSENSEDDSFDESFDEDDQENESEEDEPSENESEENDEL